MPNRFSSSPHWEGAAKILRQQIPLISALTLLLLGLVLPFRAIVGGFSPVFAEGLSLGFILAPVFYWGLFRPDLWRTPYAFGYGLMYDLLSGQAIGTSALLFTLLHRLLLSQRRLFVSGGFLVLWWGFAVVALAYAYLSAIINTLMIDAPWRWLAPFGVAILTSLTFPFIGTALIFLQRRLARI